jgi:serine/threonine protein kinase
MSLSRQHCDDDDDNYEMPEPTEWEASAVEAITALGYEIDDCVHRGVESSVWDATSDTHGQVVIKLQRPTPALATELAIGLGSAHPNVAPTIAWHWLNLCGGTQACAIVMENVDDYRELSSFIYPLGHTTHADWLFGNPHASAVRKRLCLQLLLGVAYLHDRLHLVHRDFKPENLVVTPDLAQLRIVDYGFCFILGESAPTPPIATQSPSGPDPSHALGEQWWIDGIRSFDSERYGRMGTLGYIAPEVMHYQGADDLYRADMYGVGAVVYEIFFSEEPWGSGRFYGDLYPRVAKDLQCIKLDDAYWEAFDLRYPLQRPRRLIDPVAWVLIESLLQSNPRRRPTAQQTLDTFSQWLLS